MKELASMSRETDAVSIKTDNYLKKILYKNEVSGDLKDMQKSEVYQELKIPEFPKPIEPFVVNAVENNARIPVNGGEWSNETGDSTWKPNPDGVPQLNNPENKTWEEILKEHGIDGISFSDGDPDFSEISEGEVQIDDFTESRDKNFRQADEKLAEQWAKEGKDGKEWTPREVAEWRKENGYTWHECKDCTTMQLVPSEVHNNIPHSGGISDIKKQNSANV